MSALLIILIIYNAKGQPFENSQNLLVLNESIFDFETTIHCSLTFNIKKFRKEKFEDKKIPAKMTYFESDSVTISKDIFIQARGNSRKTICYFPPIKLKLKHVSFDDLYMDTVNNQKLVTHCKSGKSYDQVLLKEYLVYKMYSILTDNSFRVRLMEMDYIDSENKIKTFNRYAFLIENIKVLAERNNCLLLKQKNLGMGHINRSSLMVFSLFQFMIGNVDWSITGLHNVKLIKTKGFGQELPYVVPYDFDYAGFVNADYARNVLNTEIKSVKTRMFVGVCISEVEYLNTIQKFISHKNEIYTLIDNFEQLESRSKLEITSYINEFFDLIEEPSFYGDYIIPYCKNYNK